jgi:type I restriction enzyme R subunit
MAGSAPEMRPSPVFPSAHPAFAALDLETNDSAVKVLGDDTLRTIARELVETVSNNVTIDWTIREDVRAQLRVLVKRVLRKYGYPPDKQEKATETMLEQAEVIAGEWVG